MVAGRKKRINPNADIMAVFICSELSKALIRRQSVQKLLRIPPN
jgi:hypothetical protein